MPDFKKLIARLKRHYGEPKLPPAQGPFELVMWENSCYLLSDERRAAVLEGLRAQVGPDAGAILNADRDTLLALAGMGGMRPETRVFRWLEIARITMSQFDGDLDRILREPYEKAKKAQVPPLLQAGWPGQPQSVEEPQGLPQLSRDPHLNMVQSSLQVLLEELLGPPEAVPKPVRGW
jgi:hypothetical protein